MNGILSEVIAAIWLKAYHRAPVLTIMITVLGLLGIGSSVYFIETHLQAQREAKRIENLNYTKQMETLNQVKESIEGLLEFVDAQREQIKLTEGALSSMKSEHEKLKPLIEADRRVIDAFFAAQEVRNQETQTKERWIGFGFGVIASMMASFLYQLISLIIKRRKPEIVANESLKRNAAKDRRAP
jgi:hypothetical protein